MAFEFNFDDEIFQESNCRPKAILGIYSPKKCDPEWFMHVSANNDQSEIQNIRKYQGDLLYHKQKYEEALIMYQESQQNLSMNNTVLDRELLESMAKCLFKLRKFDEALVLVKKAVDGSQLDCSMWHLLSQIYGAMGNLQGKINALQHCATLHSWNYQYWFSLALAYEQLSVGCVKCPVWSHKNADLGSNDLLHQHLTCKRNCKEKSLNVESLQNTDLTVNLNGCCATNGRIRPVECLEHCNSAEKQTMSSEHIYNAEHDTLAGHVKSFSTQAGDRAQEQTTAKLRFNNTCLDCTKYNITSPFVTSQRKDTFVGKAFCKCQGTTKAPSIENKLQWRSHILSFGCLIKARFFLEKAVEASSSFVKDQYKVTLTKVNDRISTHVDCGCVELKDKVLEMLYTSFIASEQEVLDLDQSNTRTQECELKENSVFDGEIAFNFEQKWFSNLLSFVSESS